MFSKGNVFLLFYIFFAFSCSKKGANSPINGSSIGAKEKFVYKIYPFSNVSGLKIKSKEGEDNVNDEILEKTEDVKFNLDKGVSIEYIDDYNATIEAYQNAVMVTNDNNKNDRLAEILNLDRFQNTHYIRGNGKILKNLKDSSNTMSIPIYLDVYLSDLRKYLQITNKKKTVKPQKVIKNKEYWQKIYYLNEKPEKKFQEIEFNYYRYLQDTFNN